jgi:hypothetical protein
MKPKRIALKQNDFATRVGQALRRSAKAAREQAKMHGTLLYFLKDGKIVAQKP